MPSQFAWRIGVVRVEGTPLDFTCLLTLNSSRVRIRCFPLYRAWDIPIENIDAIGPCLYRWFFAAPAIRVEYRDGQGRPRALVFASPVGLSLADFGFDAEPSPSSVRWPSRWLWLPIVVVLVFGIPWIVLFEDGGSWALVILVMANNLVFRRPYPTVPCRPHTSSERGARDETRCAGRA